MAHGNAPTLLAQRLAIGELAQQGYTDLQIAQRLGLRPVTVRKWRRRGQRAGRPGLSSVLGRPPRGVLSQFAPEMREAVRALRQAHPGWGGVTLRAELAGQAGWQGHRLPSPARIAVFLKNEGLTRRYDRRLVLAQPAEPPPALAHAEWEMDAQGVQVVAGVGRVVLINLADPISRLVTESWGCLHTSKPDTADYQLALRRAFLRYGLPASLSLDHDSVFYDPTSASPYPARLHLWLLALGVAVRFIPVGRPTAHGFIEHEHQVLTHQAVDGQVFEQPDALQPMLDQRREFLNTTYPNRALGGQAPLTANPAAVHSGRGYAPEREADLLDLQRVYAYLAQHRWFRQTSTKGQFFLGAVRYGLGQAWANQTLEITLDPLTVEFVCRSEDGQRTHRLPAKGLTKTDLMGELPLAQLPTYQLAFPWSRPACRALQLFRELPGTTL